MANMKLSNEGAMEIISHEAIVVTPYKDSVGVWTIGVGHTAAAGKPDPKAVTEPMAIKDVFALFQKDMEKFVADVNKAVKVELKQHQFDALVSFHFNTGGIKKAALTGSVNAKKFEQAAAEFLNWKKPPEIIGRRTKEQTLFAKGTYSGGGKARVIPADKTGKVLMSKGTTIDLAKELG
ncbi:MAG: lysozyme [Bauldia sp.]